MSRVKKISGEQFTLDCVNKAREIAGKPTFESFEALQSYDKEHNEWYSEAEFDTIEQYKEWREYYCTHIYDMVPKGTPKSTIKNSFSWFALQFGPKYNFSHDELKGIR